MEQLNEAQIQTTFIERGEDGLIRQYDMVTGEILAVIKDKDTLDKFPEELIEIEHEGKKILVQKNLPLEGLLRSAQKFEPIIGDLICEKIAEGTSPKQVLEEMNIKYSVYARWRRQNKQFAEALNLALQDRADYLADRALEEAEAAAATPGGAAKAKLVVDTLYRSAEIANQSKYSPRVKVDAKAPGATVFIIETGIRRQGDPGFFVDETAKIRNVTPAPSVESPVVKLPGESQLEDKPNE